METSGLEQQVVEPEFAAWVGIDWADQKHFWSLQEAGSERRERGELQHTPEAVEAWVTELRLRFGHRPIAVAVEQMRGALVFMLSKYQGFYLYPVPPAMSSYFRKAFYASGAKDDGKDADLLLDILRLHRARLHRLSPDSEATRLLQNLVEERRKLVDEKTAQKNRLEAYLKVYFPQIPLWFPELDNGLVCDLLERWPTLQQLQKARPATLRSFFREHHCRRTELIEQRIEAIGQARAAIEDRAVIDAKVAGVKVALRLIQVLRQAVQALDRQIEEAAAAHPDFFIFDSLPGAGAALAPRLLAAFGTQRIAGKMPASCRRRQELHQSKKAVENRNGSMSALPVPSFCGRPFMSGPAIPSPTRGGHAPTISNSVPAARGIMRRCAHWLLNGFASCSVAGKSVRSTMNEFI